MPIHTAHIERDPQTGLWGFSIESHPSAILPEAGTVVASSLPLYRSSGRALHACWSAATRRGLTLYRVWRRTLTAEAGHA